ncbi:MULTISPECIES: rod shape-determining protein [Lactobacillaceae]|uniref:rod shape-determining protein n=1 Tax=Lactobacillaceae TaxID=33958 RepID=UPI000C1B705E|nr:MULTISPECIES: rod shape-determining protein [Lactobacillaceae]
MKKLIGIDLGTANVLINVLGDGVVLNEPSMVAVNTKTNEVIAVGQDAYRMAGRTPDSIRAIRPLKDGVIADFDVTEKMLQQFIGKVKAKGRFSKPIIMICTPTDVTNVEQRAIIEAAENAGASQVYLQYEPKVAAVGSGLDIFRPHGSMVIDIGGGTSDVAVLSMGDVVASRSLRHAGYKMSIAVQNYIKNKKDLIVGEKTSENIKIRLGTAMNPQESNKYSASGIDVASGLPKEVELTEVDIYEALKPSVEQLLSVTKTVMEETPAELTADIIDQGVMLTGGGSLVKNLDKYFADELGVPVLRSENPLDSVALGTGILLENIRKHKQF